jgi:uncharacterized protein YndB with AHSA1/START domain
MTRRRLRPNQFFLPAIAVLGLAGSIPRISAAVVDSAANGFTVKLTLTIQAPPDRVYRALIRNIGEWWDSGHTFSGDAHNLSIEEKPMGCFCEKLPGTGWARHMEVVNFSPGKVLVMTGGLGPLQSLATTGAMTVRLAPAETGTEGAGNQTTLDVTYAVVGYLAGGMNALAVPVEGVLSQQFTRLKNYVEHGDAAAK